MPSTNGKGNKNGKSFDHSIVLCHWGRKKWTENVWFIHQYVLGGSLLGWDFSSWFKGKTFAAKKSPDWTLKIASLGFKSFFLCKNEEKNCCAVTCSLLDVFNFKQRFKNKFTICSSQPELKIKQRQRLYFVFFYMNWQTAHCFTIHFFALKEIKNAFF